MPSLSSPVIDVLSAESFASEHLPGAVNLCVYETAFSDKVREAFPDPDVELTVYGCNDATREAALAVEKLAAAGYTRVTVLPGGIEGWKAQGGEVTGSHAGKSTPEAGRQVVDCAVSGIEWTGQNLLNRHHGGLKLSEGWIVLNDAGAVESGELTVDMNSLSCSDLADAGMNRMLIGHLRSDDFFAVDTYPVAKFTLDSAEPIAGATAGSPNYRVKGGFTLRGRTHPLEFLAVTGPTGDGGFAAQARLSIDRTLWGSIYGSGKFFSRLGQHVVNDLVHVHLKVVTRPES